MLVIKPTQIAWKAIHTVKKEISCFCCQNTLYDTLYIWSLKIFFIAGLYNREVIRNACLLPCRWTCLPWRAAPGAGCSSPLWRWKWYLRSWLEWPHRSTVDPLSWRSHSNCLFPRKVWLTINMNIFIFGWTPQKLSSYLIIVIFVVHVFNNVIGSFHSWLHLVVQLFRHLRVIIGCVRWEELTRLVSLNAWNMISCSPAVSCLPCGTYWL